MDIPEPAPDRALWNQLLYDMARIAAAESILYGLGMMFAPAPVVLVAVGWTAAGWLAGLWFARRWPHERVGAVFTDRTEHPYSRTYGTVLAWLLIVLFTLVLWLLTHNLFERRLWESGNFGEPPYNRSVIATEVAPLGNGRFAWLLEWAVSTMQTDGVFAAADFDGPLGTDWDWLGPPGMREPVLEPVSRDALRGPSGSPQDSAGRVGFRFDRDSVFPHQSYYIYVESDERRAITECYFGDADETCIDERSCDGNVRLIVNPP